jgi:hypothetical protein
MIDDELDEEDQEAEERRRKKEQSLLSIHQDHGVAVLMEQDNRRHRQTLADLFKVGKQKGLLHGIGNYGG